MDGQRNHGEHGAAPGAGSDRAPGRLCLDDAALDLVLAATEDGDEGVVRTLLRTVVALGLTSAVGYWHRTSSAGPDAGPAWIQYRGFGGPTPAPHLPMDREAPHSLPGSHLAFWLGTQGAIVALRETFDQDGQREEREDELESLVLLAGTLLVNSHDYPLSHTGETEGEHGTPGPVPRRLPGNGEGRQAG